MFWLFLTFFLFFFFLSFFLGIIHMHCFPFLFFVFWFGSSFSLFLFFSFLGLTGHAFLKKKTFFFCTGHDVYFFNKLGWWPFFFWLVVTRLVCVFKNWKLLFKNIYGNTCGWKSVLKCVKCCLKTENGCLKTQTKHPLSFLKKRFSIPPLFHPPNQTQIREKKSLLYSHFSIPSKFSILSLFHALNLRDP